MLTIFIAGIMGGMAIQFLIDVWCGLRKLSPGCKRALFGMFWRKE